MLPPRCIQLVGLCRNMLVKTVTHWCVGSASNARGTKPHAAIHRSGLAVAESAIASPPTTDSSAVDPEVPAEEPLEVGVPYDVTLVPDALEDCGFLSVYLGGRWWWE